LVEHAPLMRSVRYPEKLLLVVHALLCVAAALGLDRVLREPRRFRIVWRTALALAVVAAVAALGVSLRPSFDRGLLTRDLIVAAASFGVVTAIAALGSR